MTLLLMVGSQIKNDYNILFRRESRHVREDLTSIAWLFTDRKIWGAQIKEDIQKKDRDAFLIPNSQSSTSFLLDAKSRDECFVCSAKSGQHCFIDKLSHIKRVCQYIKIVGKNVGVNRNNFCLLPSSICWFFVHTRQLEFAITS